MVRAFFKTVLLLTPVFLPITLVGGIFGLAGAIIGLVISFVMSLYVILNMDRIILRVYKAYPAPPGDMTELIEKTRSLSRSAGVREPSIYITELPLPGSFVIGRKPDKTVLVIPQRLLSILNSEEFDALLAYNIVQINNTIGLRTLAALISGILTMTASAIRWGAVFTGFGDYNDPAPRLFWLFVMGLVSPPAAAMVQSVSEQDHDIRAAELCSNPDALISAIEHLENVNVSGYASLGSLCLTDPETESFFEALFRAHPPKEKRIKNIAGKYR